MVVLVPIAKLVSLAAGKAAKWLSKPVANVIMKAARRSDFFKTYVCMPPAQAYHWVKTSFTKTKTNPTNEEVVELGAKLLSETVIFLVGGGCVVLEYNRQAANSRCKEYLKLEEELKGMLAGMQAQIGELAVTMEALNARLTEAEVNGILQSKSPPPKKFFPVRVLIGPEI